MTLRLVTWNTSEPDEQPNWHVKVWHQTFLQQTPRNFELEGMLSEDVAIQVGLNRLQVLLFGVPKN